MVRVVDFDQEVGDGQLKLVHPQPAGFALRRKTVMRAQKEQDIRGLAEEQLAGLQKGRRKGRVLGRSRLHEHLHLLHAAFASRDIDIIRSRLLEREPHEFAASLYLRPVVELVTHLAVSRSREITRLRELILSLRVLANIAAVLVSVPSPGRA